MTTSKPCGRKLPDDLTCARLARHKGQHRPTLTRPAYVKPKPAPKPKLTSEERAARKAKSDKALAALHANAKSRGYSLADYGLPPTAAPVPEAHFPRRAHDRYRSEPGR